MNEERLWPEWRKRVESDGRWFEPDPWPENERLRTPFDDATFDRVLDALKAIYPENATKRIFRDHLNVANMLTDIANIEQSGLFQLGYEAALVGPDLKRKLIKELQRDGEYVGARFELQLWAAMKAEGITVVFEPFDATRVDGEPNPDFSIDLDGVNHIADAKAARSGVKNDAVDKWRRAVMFGPPAAPSLIQAEIHLTDRFFELDEHARDALIGTVRATALRLGASPPPAKEVVDQAVVVIVRPDRSASTDARYDQDLEASRILRGVVSDAAKQLRHPSSIAIVSLDGFGKTDFAHVEEAVRGWFVGNGGLYPETEHVLVVGPRFACGTIIEYVHPVSRTAESPRRIARFANALTRGINRSRCEINKIALDRLPTTLTTS